MKNESQVKKAYAKPEIKSWGTIMDLTKTGQTHSGGDGKIGSITWSLGGKRGNSQ